MKKILLILFVLIGLVVRSQSYDPAAAGVPLNKAVAISQDAPTDSRSKFWDNTNFVYRCYTSTSEALSYLNLAKFRGGQFPIFINFGGTLGGTGVIVGGVNVPYWFKNGTANGDLIPMANVVSVNGYSGVVITKNADSLKTFPFDTSANRHQYVLTYDSINRKIYLSNVSSGTTYTSGTGINISAGVISALNTTALWNASQIRGFNVVSSTPATNQVLKYNGIAYAPANDNSAFDTAYYTNDTLYIVQEPGDTVKTYITVSQVGDNWGTQLAATDGNYIKGSGLGSDRIRPDTTWLATQTNIADLQYQIDNINPSDVGSKTQVLNYGGSGDSLVRYVNDSLYKAKRIIAGANVTVNNIGDTALSISSTPGTAEINTIPLTYTGTDSVSISAATMIDYILVKPASDLTALKVGIATDDDAYVTSTPVTATSDFAVLVGGIYFPSTTKVYFSGITSSTQIKIIIKPLHE